MGQIRTTVRNWNLFHKDETAIPDKYKGKSDYNKGATNETREEPYKVKRRPEAAREL